MTCCRQTSVPDIELVGDDVTLVIEGAGEVGQDPGIETRRRPGNLGCPANATLCSRLLPIIQRRP